MTKLTLIWPVEPLESDTCPFDMSMIILQVFLYFLVNKRFQAHLILFLCQMFLYGALVPSV